MSRHRPILPPPEPRKTGKENSRDNAFSILEPLKQLSVSDNSSTQPGDKALRAKGLVRSKPTSTKRPSPAELESLTGRQRKRLRDAQHSVYLEHPYKVRLDIQKSKLMRVMNKIFEIADNDLIVCDFDTGLNDYSKNLSFANELETIAKELTVLSKDCADKAVRIRDRIDQAKEDKRLIQDVVFQQEIVKDSEKCDEIRLVCPDLNFKPKPFVPKSAFRVKRERPPPLIYEDSDTDPEEEKAKKTRSGDPDTKFTYTKSNEFDELQHPNSICVDCDKVFRDKHELRNHMSNHHKELFRCLRCGNLSRTEVSFNKHMKTHTGERFTCSVCSKTFDRKTSLSNHEQQHSGEKLVCKTCGKEFIYRGGYLEHIKYRHTATPTVPCAMCKKMFYMPTGMRSHRRKRHGHVRELVYNQ